MLPAAVAINKDFVKCGKIGAFAALLLSQPAI
jgi:hypothetical protein